MSLVLIRQIPDDYADSTGLAKYNRSRMPGCKDRFSAAINESVDGRFLTGIDEDAYGVDITKKDEIKTLRQSLEKRTGKQLDGLSDYWRTFYVLIDADKPKVFDTDNAMDYIALSVLYANKNVAPDKESAYTPKYRDAQYYAYTQETEHSEETHNRKKRDLAVAELLKISEDKDRMILYGQYLEGLKYNSGLGVDTLYKMLRAYIEEKNIKNSVNFVAATKKTVQELQTKNTIDKALKQNLINRIGRGKNQIYQFGQVTLGTSIEDVYANLAKPDFAPELMALKKELDK